MEDRVLTGRGSRVLRVSDSLSRVISDSRAHRRSRRRRPLVSTAPPTRGSGSDHSLTLPISSLSQHLSALTSLGSLSVSSLYFSPPSVSPTLCVCVRVEQKRRNNRRKRRKKSRNEEELVGWGGIRSTEGSAQFFSCLFWLY
jgi:hypothetical protein